MNFAKREILLSYHLHFDISSLISTPCSISDAMIVHNGSTNDILWQRIFSCRDKGLVISRASFLNSSTFE